MKQNSVVFGQRPLNTVSFDTTHRIHSGVCKVDICNWVYCLTSLTMLVPEDKLLVNVFHVMPISFLAVKCRYLHCMSQARWHQATFYHSSTWIINIFDLRHSAHIRGELLLLDFLIKSRHLVCFGMLLAHLLVFVFDILFSARTGLTFCNN